MIISNVKYSMRMFDSRQNQRRSSSQSSGGSSSRQRRTTSEMEIDSLRQEIQKRDAFLKAQEEYQKEQQAHAERLHAQQMAAIQQSGQHINQALGDFVNNLFASGGSGHNSNEPEF
ncbi:hypothetical protein U9M48_013618 [Paspalum notatum var. saurae]|uniref:Uncharacterized protein n=1 Tax=Paspalum notatum var. saurae TaxID=547442 RepID=A0AAQ3T0R6_PASNO